jgi:ATP-dependent RNA helicase DDX54/DBP10
MFRILATPGRLLHVAVEMNLKLNQVGYVVFDEAGEYLCAY